MTVIVYRDGIMAADTATFMGDLMIAFDTQKIRRTPAGCLVACCGAVPDIERFHRWADEGFEPESSPRRYPEGALVARPDGTVWHYKSGYERTGPYQARGGWYVEGCHEEFLVGALAAGASAALAVRLAIRYCKMAGGDVQVEKLRTCRRRG